MSIPVPTLRLARRAAALVLLAAASAAAQPVAPEEPLVPSDLLAGTPLELEPMLEAAAREVEGSPITVAEAIATALSQSPDLAERVLLPAVSEARLRARQGVYALTAFAGGSAERHVSPAASALAGADEVDLREYGFGGGLRQPIAPTGGEVRLELDNSISETNSTFASLSPEYTPTLALELSQPLLRDLLTDSRRADVRLAELGVDVASLGLASDVRGTVEEVEQRYWELHYAIQETRIARLALELGKRLLDNDRRRFELGALPWPDVIDVEAAVSTAEDDLVASRRRLRDASDALRRSLGLSLAGPTLLTVERPDDTPGVPDLAGLWDRALEAREDLRVARAEVEQAQVRLDAAENLTLPDLDLEAGVGLNGLSGTGRSVSFGGDVAETSPFAGSFGDSYDTLTSGDYFDWFVGLRFEVPIFEDEADGEADVARLDVTSAERRLARLEQDARLEVRRAHDDVATAAERVRTTASVVERSGENLRAEARRYELGASRTDDVIRKIEEYSRSLVRATRVRSDLAIARARLARVTAANLEPRGIDAAALADAPDER